MFNCKQLIKSKNIALNLSRLVSCRSSSGNDIIEKWERKFEKENISEAEVSIQHILNHVVGKNVVCIILQNSLLYIICKCIFNACRKTTNFC